MHSQEKGGEELSRELSKGKPLLKLLRSIIEGPDEAWEKRRQLVKYCRSRRLEESSMWSKLALYKQGGPAEVLFTMEQGGLFADKQPRLRQRIVELIGRLPQQTVEDFKALLDFRRYFLERLEYISELLVYFFLEREKGLWRESEDSSVYTNYFNHKLFREFNAINEVIADSAGVQKLRDGYESWLLDQALDEEAPL